MRRRDLLGAIGVAVGASVLSGRARGSQPRKLITVALYGGWDTTFALDPKLGVAGIDSPDLDENPEDPDDREAPATVGGIPLLVNPVKRPEVTRFFESWGPRAIVVNGISVAAISHQASVRRVLTGSGTGRLPDVGALLGAQISAGSPLGYVDLANQSRLAADALPGEPSFAASAGRMGARDQIRTLIEPGHDPVAPPGYAPYPRWVPDDATRASLHAYLAGARSRLGSSRAGEPRLATAMADAAEAQWRAERLRRDAGSLAAGIASGPDTTFEDNASTAVEGLAEGLWHAVLLDSGWGWDSHADVPVQHELWNTTFAGLSTLMAALEAAGLLEETLVYVVSEMTRTPLRNSGNGKDHWPWATALLLGGGLAGGRVIGATDDGALGLPIDLRTGERTEAGVVPSYGNLIAGLLAHLDLDPEEHLPGVVPLAL